MSKENLTRLAKEDLGRGVQTKPGQLCQGTKALEQSPWWLDDTPAEAHQGTRALEAESLQTEKKSHSGDNYNASGL